MTMTGNLVLDSFSVPLREAIQSAARPCRFGSGTMLVHRGRNPGHLVFPTAGLASLVVRMEDGSTAEAGTLGYASLTGLSTLLGPDVNHADCVVQIAGEGLQVPRQYLLRLFDSSPEFREKTLHLAQRQMNISTQITACNLNHHALQRTARWLLTAAEHLHSSTLRLTQQTVSEMIGTRRTTATMVLGQLGDLGFLSQRRGYMDILNLTGLEGVACQCYRLCRPTPGMDQHLYQALPYDQTDPCQVSVQ